MILSEGVRVSRIILRYVDFSRVSVLHGKSDGYVTCAASYREVGLSVLLLYLRFVCERKIVIVAGLWKRDE